MVRGVTTSAATCACGGLRATCTGAPRKVSLCHCRDCQRRTGTPFGLAAFFDREQVRTEGCARIYVRAADNGHTVQHHFCPSCGSTVFWYPSRMPGLVAVAVGAFADPGFPPPTQQVFTQHRHPWVTGPAR